MDEISQPDDAIRTSPYVHQLGWKLEGSEWGNNCSFQAIPPSRFLALISF